MFTIVLLIGLILALLFAPILRKAHDARVPTVRQRWTRTSLAHSLAAALVLSLFALGQSAHAGYEVVAQSATIATGTAGTTQSIMLRKCIIRDVIVYCPTLDSGDTASVNVAGVLGDLTYTPTGYTAKSIGATQDGGLIKCNSSQLNIIADGEVRFALLPSSNQIADRTYIIYFLIEY